VGSCSQEKSATKCVSVKGIGAGAGPLPSPVYRLFGLVGVGPYRSLGTRTDYQTWRQSQRIFKKSFRKKVIGGA
jgi:hypothetical protein